MDIEINEVQEIIKNLDSGGEISIKEEKYLKVAKLCAQLAAENVAIREYSEEVYAAGYNHGYLNTVDGIAYADCVKDEFYSLALQVMAEVETPATDRIVAGIKADAITASLDACSDYLETECVMDRLDISYEEAEKRTSGAIEFHDAMVDFANQVREGAK